jgi:hypothetical protein
MADLWRVKTTITGDHGAPWYSQQYFATSIGLDTQSAVDAVGAFWDSLKSYIHISNSVNVSGEVDVVDIDTGSLTGVVAVDDVNVTTTKNTTPLPDGIQACGSYGTGVYVSGRELRGRLFVPGLTTDAMSNGRLESGMAGVIKSSLDNLTAATLMHEMVVYSRTHHVAAPCVTTRVNTEFSMLRSRRT